MIFFDYTNKNITHLMKTNISWYFGPKLMWILDQKFDNLLICMKLAHFWCKVRANFLQSTILMGKKVMH